MRLLLLVLSAGFLCSCTKSNPPAPPVDPLLFTPEQLLDSSDFWTYRDFNSFCGRTFVLGFVNGNGRILHLEFEEEMRSPDQDTWKCILKRYHADPGAIVIEPGSGLEHKVLAMMEFVAEYDSGHIILQLPDLALARKMLASRNTRTSFHRRFEADPVPLIPRLVPQRPSSHPDAKATARDLPPPHAPPFTDRLPVPGLPEAVHPAAEEPEDWKTREGGAMDSEARHPPVVGRTRVE